jgi:serine/threonine protein kinase/tetratricopeptide (TPR) repeat protein
MSRSSTVFAWSLKDCPEGDGDPQRVEAKAVEQETCATVNGRYRPRRKLGSGGTGSVWLVEDLLDGGRLLALKLLQPGKLDRNANRTLQNEFRVLSLLRHPGVAGVHDFGKDFATQGYYFTAEYVDGIDLSRLAMTHDFTDPRNLHACLDVLVQILRALEFVHSRGLVHADIKPGNVLLSGKTDDLHGYEPGDLHVRLIDFGLVRTEKEFGSRDVMGTIQYLAPEVISGAQIDRRADLYSLGAVAYALLAGRYPFEGTTNLGVLKAHLHETPPPIHEINDRVPRALSDLIMRLLDKLPSNRPSTAADIIDSINRSGVISAPIETFETSLSYLRFPRNDAHAKHVSALSKACLGTWKVRPSVNDDSEKEIRFGRDRIQTLRSTTSMGVPRGRTVFIRGERRIGKASLVQRFKAFVQTRGAIFLAVECRTEDSSSAEWPSDLVSLLSEIIALERCVSTKHHVLTIAQDILSNKANVAPEGFAGLLEKLARYLLFLSLDQQIVLHLGQFQRGSKLLVQFAELLLDCQIRSTVKENQLLLTATLCEDEYTRETPAADFVESEDVRENASFLDLQRLETRELAQVLESMFPGHRFPESFLQLASASSDGNPGVLEEIGAYLLSSKKIRRTARGWEVHVENLDELLPGQIRTSVESTIDKLSPQAVRLAIAFAYLGSGTSLSLATRVARLPADVADECIETLLRTRLLRFSKDDRSQRFEFVHRTAKDILYEMVPVDERADFHARAGRVIEISTQDHGDRNPKVLSRHFRRAGLLEEAMHYGMLAVEAYTREFDSQSALDVYLKLFELARQSNVRLPAPRFLELAQLLFQLGRYDEARRVLLDIESQCIDHDVKIDVHLHTELARIDTKVGDFARVRTWLDRVAVIIGDSERWCRERARMHLAEARVSFVRGLYEDCCHHCRAARIGAEKTEDLEIVIEACLLIADAHFVLGRRTEAFESCVVAMRLSDSRKGSTSRESTLYCLAKYHKYRDRFAQARISFLMCAEIRAEMGARDGEAEALMELGSLDLFLGKFQEAACAFKRAAKICAAVGNRIVLVKARNLQAESQRLLGEYEEARDAAKSALDLATELGIDVGISEALFVHGKMLLDNGKLVEAERALKEAFPDPPNSPRSELKLLDFQCVLFFHRGDFERLLRCSTEGVDLARRMSLPVLEAQFLEHRSSVYLRMGCLDEVREDAANLREAAHKYSLPLSLGRAYVVEARVAALLGGDANRASELFRRAKRIFVEGASDRDLVQCNFWCGTFLFENEKYMQAFLMFEEGLFLAKKLQLSYWVCLFYYSCGRLTRLIPDGTEERADKLFAKATRLAERAPYGDLLWKVKRCVDGAQGTFYFKRPKPNPSGEIPHQQT